MIPRPLLNVSTFKQFRNKFLFCFTFLIATLKAFSFSVYTVHQGFSNFLQPATALTVKLIPQSPCGTDLCHEHFHFEIHQGIFGLFIQSIQDLAI